MIGILLARCAEPETPAAEVYDGAWDDGASAYGPLGAAAWDPLRLVVGEDEAASPVVFGDGDARLPMPLTDDVLTSPTGLYRIDGDDLLRTSPGFWALPAIVGWGRGTTGAARFHDAPLEWEVGEYGRASEFDALTTIGRWSLQPQVEGGVPDIMGVASASVGPLHLEILDAADGEATFRLIATIYGTTDECVLLEDRAALSATGELSWSMDRIEAVTEPDPIVLYRPRFRIGFDGSDAAAGGEAEAIVDVRATEATSFDVCEMGRSFGDPCIACEDDGYASCMPFATFAWTAERVDEPMDDTLPVCGADFTDTGTFPDWSFEIDCGDWSGTLCAGLGFFAILPLARRARKTRGP